MAEGRDLAKWIRCLADSEPGKRRAAAAQLHSAGATLFLSAARDWLKDPEFRELVSPFFANTVGEPDPENIPFSIGIAVQPENFEKIRAANGSPGWPMFRRTRMRWNSSSTGVSMRNSIF